jgi:hypothetical protein
MVAAIGFGAAVATVCGWIPLPRGAIPLPDAPPAVITPRSLESQPAATVAVPEPPAESVQAWSTISVAENAQRERLSGIQRQVAEEMYARSGNDLVDDLSAQGLARADGEIIVRRAMDGYSSCMLDAFRSIAQERSRSFVVVLDAIEASLSDSDGPEVDTIIDVNTAIERALPCMQNVGQQAGLPVFP